VILQGFGCTCTSKIKNLKENNKKVRGANTLRLKQGNEVRTMHKFMELLVLTLTVVDIRV